MHLHRFHSSLCPCMAHQHSEPHPSHATRFPRYTRTRQCPYNPHKFLETECNNSLINLLACTWPVLAHGIAPPCIAWEAHPHLQSSQRCTTGCTCSSRSSFICEHAPGFPGHSTRHRHREKGNGTCRGVVLATGASTLGCFYQRWTIIMHASPDTCTLDASPPWMRNPVESLGQTPQR